MPIDPSFLMSAALPLSMVAASGPLGGDASIQGSWLPSTAELGGKPFPDEIRKVTRLVIEGDAYTVTVGDVVDRGGLKVNPEVSPGEMDITGAEGPNRGRTILAIYEVDGSTMRICYDLGGQGRPSEFNTAEGTQLYLVTYQREKP